MQLVALLFTADAQIDVSKPAPQMILECTTPLHRSRQNANWLTGVK
jgi:hypothetical protein